MIVEHADDPETMQEALNRCRWTPLNLRLARMEVVPYLPLSKETSYHYGNRLPDNSCAAAGADVIIGPGDDEIMSVTRAENGARTLNRLSTATCCGLLAAAVVQKNGGHIKIGPIRQSAARSRSRLIGRCAAR